VRERRSLPQNISHFDRDRSCRHAQILDANVSFPRPHSLFILDAMQVTNVRHAVHLNAKAKMWDNYFEEMTVC